VSIKFKLSISLGTIVLIVMFIIQFVAEREYQDFQLNQLNQIMDTTSNFFDSQLHLQEGSLNNQLEKLTQLLQLTQPFLFNVIMADRESDQIAYRSYSNMDEELSQLIYDNHISYAGELSELQYHGTTYLMSSMPMKSNSLYQIAMLYDKNEYLKSNTHEYAFIRSFLIIMMLVVLVLTYVLVIYTMRPLKDILKKVNEVSSFKFQSPISVKTSDEFGVLSFKINAMSQNLSIYMNKLRTAFNENRRMRLYLESFINHSSDAIYLLDIDGKLIQANDAFEKLFGYKESELLGKPLCNIPEALLEEKENIFKRVREGQATSSVETFRYDKNGELIPVSITISPIRESDEGIIGFANVCRDMRHRNRMEELLRRSEKLTVVGQLAAGVAHEIRNPLTTLKGFLQLQQKTGQSNESHIKVMLSELDRINFIVSEFLILAKPQAVKFKTRDIRDVMNEVINLMVSEAALHNIELRYNFADEQCVVSCEENQLKQVFINVLKNAIEAMPFGGQVHIAIQRKSKYIKIHVTDEGVGIDEITLSKIGDPFFTAKENGTGLGIMVSQRIIHTHHGQFQIKSQVNVGTTIEIQLPLGQEEEYAEASSL